jgi:hypothetical protein
MARRTKDAPGRVTPKGGRVTPKGGAKPGARAVVPPPSGRYTPPIPKVYNYLGLLPGGAKNAYLFVGLGFITAGFITATRYR